MRLDVLLAEVSFSHTRGWRFRALEEQGGAAHAARREGLLRTNRVHLSVCALHFQAQDSKKKGEGRKT